MRNKMMAGFAAVAFSVAGWAAVAQQAATPQAPPANKAGDKEARHGQMMQRHMEKAARELNLNDQQKPQFDAVMKSQMEKMKTLHEEQEAKMKQLHESGMDEMSKFLTPEQMTKLKEMHQRMGRDGDGMRMRHKKHHGGPDHEDGPPPPPKQ